MNNKFKLISLMLAAGALAACTGTGSSSSSSSSSTSSSSSSSSSASSSSSSSSGGAAVNSLIINEIVAKSASADYLAGNDWVELYNAGATSINLANYTLADSASEKLPLPSITLAAGQYIVIAAVDDKDANPPTPSVKFKLGGADAVYLYANGALISSLNWAEGAAPEASSYGLFNGAVQTLKPTPGAANALPSTTTPTIVRGKPSGNSPLRISEVVAQSDRPNFQAGADWLELINDSNTAVNLAEFSLTDDANPLEALPNVSLPAGGRVVVVAGGVAPL
ncbi:MAG: lamin tail domain-containing protein, partial [Moraxellaceae bacterium]